MKEDQNKRDHGRIGFGKSLEAHLVAIDGTWKYPCLVDDMSAEGAKLAIEGKCPVDKGKEFFLLFSKVGVVYRRCELSWINGGEIGVHFLNGKKAA